MVNPFRGEVPLDVDGVTLPMRLNLGALAELEERMGADGLLPLLERFESSVFKANDIIILLHAGLKGAGWNGSESDLRNAVIGGGPMAAAKAAGSLLRLTFSLPDAPDEAA